ncbi:MAG: hypothetical protein Q8O66_00500 [bacterium]|nr:hypothetical protein [bacterium]
MPEKNSQESKVSQPEIPNSVETYSIDIEKIKAEERAKSLKPSEIKRENTDTDIGVEKKEEEPLPIDAVEGVGYTYIPQEVKKYKDIRKKIEVPQPEIPTPPETQPIDAERIKAEETKATPVEILRENETPQPEILIPPETQPIDAEQIRAQEIKERAIAEFPQILKSIDDAREKNQKEAENSFYAIAPEIYREATGEELTPKVDEMAESNLEEIGKKVIKIKDYLSPERKTDTQEKVIKEEQSLAILRSWEALSPKEKKKYAENGTINPNKFISEFVARKKVLLKKEDISENAFNHITNEGFDAKNIKKRGFLRRILGGAAVEVPTLDGSGSLTFSSKKEFKGYLKKKESDAKDFIEREAKKRLDRKIIEGRMRIGQEKNRCVRKIFQEVVEKKELATKIETEQRIEAERKAKEEELRLKEEELRAKEEEVKNSKTKIVSKMGGGKKPEQRKKNNPKTNKQRNNSKRAA